MNYKKGRNSHYTNEMFRHHQTYEIYTQCKFLKNFINITVIIQKYLLIFDILIKKNYHNLK